MRKTRKYIASAILVLAILTAGVGVHAAQLAYGAASVAVPILNLRAGPGTEFDIIARLMENDTVVVLGRENPEWYVVNFQGSVGYVSTEFLYGVLATGDFAARGRLTGSMVNVRSTPDIYGDVIEQRREHSFVDVVGISHGWYRIRAGGGFGYVRSDLLEITLSPGATATGSALGQQLVSFAMGYLGFPYRSAGMSPAGFDCSGFVSYVFRNFDIVLTRNSAGQYSNDGVPVSRYELLPGDLVFFGSGGRVSHVGMYIGNCEFIHSSTYETGVRISSLNHPSRIRGWIGARRVI